MGMTATFQRMTQFGLLLSCDSDLKSDWVFQLSGSRSNSFYSRKLPGLFSLPKRPGNKATLPPAILMNPPNPCNGSLYLSLIPRLENKSLGTVLTLPKSRNEETVTSLACCESSVLDKSTSTASSDGAHRSCEELQW